MNKTTTYTHRFFARVIIEAATPISVGTGDKDIMTDQLIVRDVNGFPYIPGTAIAGILRHAMGEELAKSFFGTDEGNGKGSEIIFSSACLVVDDNKVIEGIFQEEETNYLKIFREKLIRQHVRMNDKGTTDDGGKFDGEVVYKGTRFCFEIEMVSKNDDNKLFKDVLKKLASHTFRIGSGTRSGYGEINIVECKTKYLNLKEDWDVYVQKTSSLNDKFWTDSSLDINDITSEITTSPEQSGWIEYKLTLKPEDFFLFGSGFGNNDADITPVLETKIVWKNNKPVLIKNGILIPGSSVKGALSHRTAYYYNKNNQYFAGNDNAKAGNDNFAVKELFGYVKEGESDSSAMRGNVIISDIIEHAVEETITEPVAKKSKKILNHVAIDRFTGGAIDGALYSEEVMYLDEEFELFIYVNSTLDFVNAPDVDIKTPLGAFECALNDLVNGMLPLGGGVNRGHGCFSGNILRNGIPLNKK